MSPDFRYHIASLAAVFLALGVGILIGTAFVGAPVVSRQTRLIGNLESSVNDLRKETAERQQTEEALRELAPGLVRGKLSGKRVLVVQTGTDSDAAVATVEALHLAGATSVQRVALPADAWLHPANTDPPDTPSENELTDEGRQIAAPLAAASNETLADFRDRGLITGDTPLTGAVRYIVLVGGGTTAPAPTPAASPGKGKSTPTPVAADTSTATLLARTRDVALIQAWEAQGITVVGVESFSTEVSSVRTYQSAGIATIDAIDRAVGRIALPFALLGEKGDYGIKPTADRVLPASLDQTNPPASVASGIPTSTPAP